jgi:hypothetical protein
VRRVGQLRRERRQERRKRQTNLLDLASQQVEREVLARRGDGSFLREDRILGKEKLTSEAVCRTGRGSRTGRKAGRTEEKE